MRLSKKGIDFCKSYESLHDGDLSMIGLQPKLDARGIWTEGYGHAMTRNGKFMTVKGYPTMEAILPFATINTEQEAEALLRQDVQVRERLVNGWLKVPLSQNQFDALLMHTFNCGKSGTLYRLINSKAPTEAIKKWWLTKYITAGGRELKGLKLRRLDEWEMWDKADYLRHYKLREV